MRWSIPGLPIGKYRYFSSLAPSAPRVGRYSVAKKYTKIQRENLRRVYGGVDLDMWHRTAKFCGLTLDAPTSKDLEEPKPAERKPPNAPRTSKPIPPGGLLLEVPQAGDYIGRTVRAIEHMIASKELPVVRRGRRVHLHRRDLDAWIEKNKS
jgi:excisionase family DNA binding protein